MKLLIENVEKIDYVTESFNDKKSLYITGPFLVGEQVNKNGRYYPIGLLEREVSRYTKERINEKCAAGELNHPSTPNLNLDRISHVITELRRDGNNYIGKAKIAESQPMGQIVKGLILDEGMKLGVSSRGVGSLKQHEKGYNIVQEDFRLCVAADIVSDPSGPGAFVKGIMEGAEWIYDSVSGTWMEERIDNTQKELHKLNKRQLEERTVAIFESLMRDIAKL